ncbi:hypothetical protein BK140_22635 [Paenibacillus macerans]|nr:hypothetical protein BK140_22635 [Paenibacillus macerans]
MPTFDHEAGQEADSASNFEFSRVGACAFRSMFPAETFQLLTQVHKLMLPQPFSPKTFSSAPSSLASSDLKRF